MCGGLNIDCLHMAEKVPLPGTGMELDSSDGLTGNVGTIVKGGFGFMVLFIMIALGAWLFSNASSAAGKDGDVNVPVV